MKTKIIIIRGCKFKVKIKDARELEEIEKKLIKEDWSKNRV